MEKEAANFLVNKVGEPDISRYIRHIAPFPNARKAPLGIVPDLHAYNYPTGRQRVNDSGATSSAEAIFEVKTYNACPTRYEHNNDSIRPADRRAREVLREYNGKLRKLDRRFAPEVVGDEDNPDIVGPFSEAKSRFFRRHVIPLCSGWFGEVHKDFHDRA